MNRYFQTLVLFTFIGALALAGCGGGSTSATATPTVSSVTSADAVLKHQPIGGADLSWDPSTKVLTVKITTLTGLAPNSAHPAYIRAGTCAGGGNPIYTFHPDLMAGAKGDVPPTTQAFNNVNVANGIPASGWFINVHNGSGGDVYNTMDIACANISNPTPNPAQTQSAHVDFTRGYGPSQNASGSATLAIHNGNQLVVTVTVTGLEPNSTHAVHVHKGSCQNQGDIVYAFPTDKYLKADGSGKATESVTFDNVSSIHASGLYVNVHRGTNMQSSIDFDPIACGDVTAM